MLRPGVSSGLDFRMEVSLSSDPSVHARAGTDQPDFLAHDRNIPLAAARSAPWLLSDLWSRPPEDPREREAEDRLKGIMRSGLVVPVHAPGQRFAAAQLASDLGAAELEKLDRETRPTVFLMTAMFNDRLQAMLGEELVPGAGLSERELECLLWAARGKTGWETSIILSISESAVKKHLAAAATKLNALTRTQAVAAAVSRGLISP